MLITFLLLVAYVAAPLLINSHLAYFLRLFFHTTILVAKSHSLSQTKSLLKRRQFDTVIYAGVYNDTANDGRCLFFTHSTRIEYDRNRNVRFIWFW